MDRMKTNNQKMKETMMHYVNEAKDLALNIGDVPGHCPVAVFKRARSDSYSVVFDEGGVLLVTREEARKVFERCVSQEIDGDCSIKMEYSEEDFGYISAYRTFRVRLEKTACDGGILFFPRGGAYEITEQFAKHIIAKLSSQA